MKREYAIIFNELSPSQIQNIIKYHPKYDSILNYPLNLIGAIYQSLHKPIRAKNTYMSLTEYLSRMMNNWQQYKELLVDNMDRFKQ